MARIASGGGPTKTMPASRHLDFGGCSHPAEATGGDFFDFFTLSDGSVGLVIGDASGHGFGPALLAAVTAIRLPRQTFRACEEIIGNREHKFDQAN